MTESNWETIPAIALENIYKFLNGRDRFSTSLVCHRWNSIFRSPSLWRRIVIDASLVSSSGSRIVYEKAYMRRLMCFEQVGAYIHELIFPATSNFYLLNKYLCVLSHFLESCVLPKYSEDDIEILSQLQSFKFTFYAERDELNPGHVYGTGGPLLKTIRRVLSNLTHLNSLSLHDLLLSIDDAQFLLEDFIAVSGDSLTSLSYVNVCMANVPLFEVSLFPNLRRLEICMIYISIDLLVMLAKSTLIEELIFIQDELTPIPHEEWSCPVDIESWRDVEEIAPYLRVYLHLVKNATRDLVFPAWTAPVAQIAYMTNSSFYPNELSISNISEYHNTLTSLVLSHTFSNALPSVDNFLFLVGSSCPHLTSLILRGSVCADTLIWLIHHCSVRRLVLPSSGVKLRLYWTEEKLNLKREVYLEALGCVEQCSYRVLEKLIANYLNQPFWKLLDDIDFDQAVNKI